MKSVKPGAPGKAFLLLVGVVLLVLGLGTRGASKYLMLFIGVTLLAALLIGYENILSQLNGLGKAVK